MSHPPRTHHDRPDRSGSGELQLSTLLIAAVASAVAAFVTSQVWPGGTLWSAAASPVIVALVREALNRPASPLQTGRLGRGRRTRGIEAGEPAVPRGGQEEVGPIRVYGGRS